MGDIALRGNRLTFAKGGRAGHAHGMSAGKQAIKRITERLGGGEEGKPHSTKKGRIASGVRRIKRGLSARQRDKWGDLPPWKRDPKRLPKQPWESKAEGGRIGFKKGTDKKWMQKVSASIKKRGTKGKCTPITKKGCTGRALALAKTFKKIAAKRKA